MNTAKSGQTEKDRLTAADPPGLKEVVKDSDQPGRIVPFVSVSGEYTTSFGEKVEFPKVTWSKKNRIIRKLGELIAKTAEANEDAAQANVLLQGLYHKQIDSLGDSGRSSISDESLSIAEKRAAKAVADSIRNAIADVPETLEWCCAIVFKNVDTSREPSSEEIKWVGENLDDTDMFEVMAPFFVQLVQRFFRTTSSLFQQAELGETKAEEAAKEK